MFFFLALYEFLKTGDFKTYTNVDNRTKTLLAIKAWSKIRAQFHKSNDRLKRDI